MDKANINKAMKDIMAGKTAVSVGTTKLRGKAIVRGGAGRGPPPEPLALPDHWAKILGGCGLDDITPHILRHSFASIANDLGFTETTVAALLGHAKGSVTGRYIHTMDAVLIAAADIASNSREASMLQYWPDISQAGRPA